jgi:hypothetical protein
MVEAGKMRLVEKVPGKNGEICVLETTVHERFSMTLLIGKSHRRSL